MKHTFFGPQIINARFSLAYTYTFYDNSISKYYNLKFTQIFFLFYILINFHHRSFNVVWNKIRTTEEKEIFQFLLSYHR